MLICWEMLRRLRAVRNVVGQMKPEIEDDERDADQGSVPADKSDRRRVMPAARRSRGRAGAPASSPRPGRCAEPSVDHHGDAVAERQQFLVVRRDDEDRRARPRRSRAEARGCRTSPPRRRRGSARRAAAPSGAPATARANITFCWLPPLRRRDPLPRAGRPEPNASAERRGKRALGRRGRRTAPKRLSGRDAAGRCSRRHPARAEDPPPGVRAAHRPVRVASPRRDRAGEPHRPPMESAPRRAPVEQRPQQAVAAGVGERPRGRRFRPRGPRTTCRAVPRSEPLRPERDGRARASRSAPPSAVPSDARPVIRSIRCVARRRRRAAIGGSETPSRSTVMRSAIRRTSSMPMGHVDDAELAALAARR